MQTLLSVLFFSLGTCFGSFMLLIGMRLPEKRPIALARSQCDHCQQCLSALDLVPLFSFLLLRGRCRYCQQQFSPAHFWFELAGGAILLVLQKHYGSEPGVFLYYALVYSILFIMAAVDVHYLYFPDRFQVALLLLLLARVGPGHIWLETLLGAAALLLLFYLAERVAPDGLGGGDKKLLLTFTLTLGIQPALTVLFWAATGCLIAFFLRNLRTKSLSPLPLPFGPFLATAFFLFQEGFLGSIR